jgi:hypothetical protein
MHHGHHRRKHPSKKRKRTEAKSTKTVHIFYSSASEDQPFLDELEKRLKPLKQITTWSEREIQPGAHREREIDAHLNNSDIILLLVSPSFLASDRCSLIQQRAIALREAKNTVVIPIILHPTPFWEQTQIGALQPLPANGKPISEWRSRPQAFAYVATEIYEVVQRRLAQPELQANVKEEFVFFGLYPTEGFRWNTDFCLAPGLTRPESRLATPWLVSRPFGIADPAQQYPLFEEKDALRRFMRLSPTLEAIKHFADTHGYLGIPVALYDPKKDGQPDNVVWMGESLRFWQREIEEIRVLVTLWELIRDKQIEMLTKHIIWHRQPRGVRFEWLSPDSSQHAWITKESLLPEEAKEKHQGPLYLWTFGDVINPALYYLCTQINQRLAGHVNPTLFPLQRKEMYVLPDCLLSALYVLLAMEVREQPADPGITPL